MDLATRIQEWVAIDNRIKRMNEDIKRDREERQVVGHNILSMAEASNMKHAVVQITDGKLKFQDTRVTAPLTFRFLAVCLEDCIGDTAQVKQIIDYIKQKREVRYVPEIKRTYTQTS